jgi:hypothetical protein
MLELAVELLQCAKPWPAGRVTLTEWERPYHDWQ